MRSGISASAVWPQSWRKSTFSGPQGGDCVEVAELETGSVAVRDSKDPHGPAIVHTRQAMARFVHGVKAGRSA